MFYEQMCVTWCIVQCRGIVTLCIHWELGTIWMLIGPCVCSGVFLFVCFFVCLFTGLFLCVCLSLVSLWSVCLSVCLPACLLVFVFILWEEFRRDALSFSIIRLINRCFDPFNHMVCLYGWCPGQGYFCIFVCYHGHSIKPYATKITKTYW